MPRLHNIRRERFCREYIKTGIAARAYRAAGFKTTTAHSTVASGSRMLTFDDVKSRIGELRRQMTYKSKISLESLLSDLAEDRALARSLGQASAAIQATVTAAKLVGLMVDRKESGAPGEFASLSAEQLLAKVRADHGDKAAELMAQALRAAETTEAADDAADPQGPLN
jgi:hypothetical protein